MKTVVKQHLRKGKIVKAHKRACGSKKLLGSITEKKYMKVKKKTPKRRKRPNFEQPMAHHDDGSPISSRGRKPKK